MTGPRDAVLSVAFAGRIGNFDLDVAFDAPLGSVTALYGPSGSGKTTVLRAIAGLNTLKGRCAVGRLVWQDPITFVPTHRRAVGYVFQEPSLFAHLSVRDNLSFGMRRVTFKKTIGYDSVIELLGLWKLLDRATANLSGGERQRVSLGRALLSQPRLLLLDEPLSALDRNAKDELLPYLETLHTTLGIPMLLVSHDIAEVERLAGHIIAIAGGRVTASGPANEMLLSDALGLKRGRDPASVLTGTVEAFIDHDWLSEITVGGRRLLVAGRAGDIGQTVRLRIGARDVSIAVSAPPESTILNIVPSRIVAVEKLPGADANVMLELGGQLLLARVTRRSVDALNLTVGLQVFAQVKGVSVVSAPAD